MRKTRVHFEKIGNIKGAFPARMGMIKVKNGKNLTKVEEIKGGKIHRRTFFFFFFNGFNDPDRHNAVVTHLEPDILDCEAKLALRSSTGEKKLVDVMEFHLSI